ncbi:MAG: NUDIX hydrolase [Bacteroidota bacterium]
MKETDFYSLENKIKTFVPGISLDCVVFGYQDRSLHILLLKCRNTDVWALPGGFLPANSEMEEEACNILEERTGAKNIYLTQFYTFSSLKRGWNCNELSAKTFRLARSIWPKEFLPTFDLWFNQRFISTAFVALVDAKKVTPTPDFISEACLWVPVKELPQLILDHGVIIKKALEYLRTRINYLPIGKELLDEKFTMIDLQVLYEAILGKQLDRGNFYRKIMKLNMLKRHEKLMTGAQNKAPYLYSIDNKVYDQLIINGIGFI